ncbi:hypothetical protein F66182_809 [Fusarium sp. NRRL 66182]|nr:hypothetical protein F66182_809 [Fusarium sp. NRRL 66182]
MDSHEQSCSQCIGNPSCVGPYRDDKRGYLDGCAVEQASRACRHHHSSNIRRRVSNTHLALFTLCIAITALVVFSTICSHHLLDSASSPTAVAPPTIEVGNLSALDQPEIVDSVDDTWAFGGYTGSNCPSSRNPINEGGSKASGCLQTSVTDPENVSSYSFYTAKADSAWAVCLYTSRNCQGSPRQGSPFHVKGCNNLKIITLSARVIDSKTQKCRDPIQ